MAAPLAATEVPALDAMVIVKVSVVGVEITSKVFVVKSAAEYPAPTGGVTEVKVNNSPVDNPCKVLLTVTVGDVFTVVKVAPVIADSKGVIS